MAERSGPWGWLAGPARLSAARVVPGERGTVERALARWMQEEELLQLKRRYPDRTTWEPKVGAFASIQRALGTGGKSYALARAAEVAGQVTQLEPGFCHVQLVAGVRNQRKARLSGAAALAALAIAVAALATAVPLAIISPILFVDGHAAKHDFTKALKADPQYPIEETKDWIWYQYSEAKPPLGADF